MKIFRMLFSICLVVGLLFGTISVVSAEEEPPEEETLEEVGLNPVVEFLAELTELSTEEILTLQESYGLGEIAKAYFLIKNSYVDKTYEEVLTHAKEMGWGEYFKSLDLHPGQQGGIGQLRRSTNLNEDGEMLKIGKPDKPGKPWHGGPPEHAYNDKPKGPNK